VAFGTGVLCRSYGEVVLRNQGSANRKYHAHVPATGDACTVHY
jgi:hypothetical protein